MFSWFLFPVILFQGQNRILFVLQNLDPLHDVRHGRRKNCYGISILSLSQINIYRDVHLTIISINYKPNVTILKIFYSFHIIIIIIFI